ncbi:hypothetical protein [Methylobacterium sp. AMS5]|uniref:hypothetical protein n=1 Tax=Methylobacterium sp. AMS5 TaxID=925818 RepID=UPI00074FA49C|nr:hypothetical protein [Methylobacterium sp. AMS5]AMB43834.1 hypothetical protein Y590_02955 [Methylobacterium sp. AMS5]
MTEHGRETLRRLGARARRDFSRAHMSDTTWRKRLCALDEAGFGRGQIIVQFIACPGPRVMTRPTRADLWPPRPSVDSIAVGPFELRAIAWRERPTLARWPSRDGRPVPTVPQDGAHARAVPEVLGRLPLEETEQGLPILGFSGRWSET